MKMEFIDLAAQQKRIREDLESRMKKVLDHGQYIMGPEVKELEGKLAAYVGVKHAIACASGTDALLMALMAHNVGPGDAILTTPFTFIATAEVISLLGATPVFVDIDKQTFNIDPAQIEKAIKAVRSNDMGIHPLPEASGLKLKGIIPVDLFGLPADYDRIEKIAKTEGLFVIEDAAQSFGAEYKGKKACSFGDIACSSFFPAKPLGCYGDGGMCFTDDRELAEAMLSIRIHGKGSHKYDNVRIGINGRLDTMQAAVLLSKFSIFPEELELRQKVSGIYSDTLKRINSVKVPQIPRECRSAWAQYSILAQSGDHRFDLQKRLGETGIPTAIYYPKPLHLQSAFSYLGYQESDFPISEYFASRIFSVPMHPYLKKEHQKQIYEQLL